MASPDTRDPARARPSGMGLALGLAQPGFVASKVEARRPDGPGSRAHSGLLPARESGDGDIAYLGSE